LTPSEFFRSSGFVRLATACVSYVLAAILEKKMRKNHEDDESIFETLKRSENFRLRYYDKIKSVFGHEISIFSEFIEVEQ